MSDAPRLTVNSETELDLVRADALLEQLARDRARRQRGRWTTADAARSAAVFTSASDRPARA